MFGKKKQYKKLANAIGENIHWQIGTAFQHKPELIETSAEIAFTSGYVQSYTFTVFSHAADCRDMGVIQKYTKHLCEGAMPERLWDIVQRGSAMHGIVETMETKTAEQQAAYDAYEFEVSVGIQDGGERVMGGRAPESLAKYLIGETLVVE